MRISLLIGLFLFLSCLCAAVDINGCETLNNASVDYKLTTDISVVSGSCLYIAASNITLDCAGYSITALAWDIVVGTSTASYSNITIQNCELLGNGGIYLINGYRYGYASVGYTKDVIINNTIDAAGGGIYTYYGKDMNITNNTINVDSGTGIYDWGSIIYDGVNHYDHDTINVASGEAFRLTAGGDASITYSNITALAGIAIYSPEYHGGNPIIDQCMINASVGSYSYSGAAPIFRNTDIYVNQSGFYASWADFGYVYDSQVIANGTGNALLCDNIGYFPYYDFFANNTNFTSVNATAIINGNYAYGIACRAVINNSYIYSQYDDAYVGFAGSRYSTIENSVFVANAPLKSCIINHGRSYFRNDTLYSNTSVGGFELQDLSHGSAVYSNLTFNGTGYPTSVDISNITAASHAAFASARLPFNTTNMSGLILNATMTAGVGNIAYITLYYINSSPYDLAAWEIWKYDGVSNVNSSYQWKNTTTNTIEFVAAFNLADSNLFSLLANGTMLNWTTSYGTCYYYGNCTTGTACTSNDDCASGICFDGACIDSGGCVGDGCSALPDSISVIMLLLGDAPTLKFLLALIFICAAAAFGFNLAREAGALACGIIMMIALAVLPDPLIDWWVVIIVLICGAVAMLYSRKEGAV